MKRALLVFAMTLLAGCAAPIASEKQRPDLASAQIVAAHVTIEDSGFDKAIKYIGPASQFDDRRPNGYIDNVAWRLRSWRDRGTSAFVHQLYVEIEYGARSSRRYYGANFADSAGVESVRINYDVRCFQGGCRHTEHVGLPLNDSRLRTAVGEPLVLRLNSRAGVETFIIIPGGYVRGYLTAIDAKPVAR